MLILKLNNLTNLIHGSNRLLGIRNQITDDNGNLSCRLIGLLCKLLNLRSNHCKSFSGLSRSGRLNGGIQRKKVGLLCNTGNDIRCLHNSMNGLVGVGGLLIDLIHRTLGLLVNLTQLIQSN